MMARVGEFLILAMMWVFMGVMALAMLGYMVKYVLTGVAFLVAIVRLMAGS